MFEKVACVDIDGVLVNLELFKRAYLSLFENAGVTKEIYAATYEQIKIKGYYDVDSHLKLLNQFTSVDASDLRKKIKRFFFEQKGTYIYSDAAPFLAALKDLEYKILILSTGTRWFQKAKIDGGLSAFCIDEIHVTTEPLKSVAFSKIYSAAPGAFFIMIDDTATVLNALKTAFPDLFAVQILRDWDSSKMARLADVVVPNLT